MKVSRRFLAVTCAVTFQYSSASRKLPKGPPQDPPHEPGEVETPDLGDLIRLYRDEATSVPILTDVVPAGLACDDTEVTAGCCLWPLASEDCQETCVLEIDNYRVIHPESIDSACAVNTTCANCTMETDFGRISSARAPADMFDKSYIEAITLLRQSVCKLYQDPSGRVGYFAELDGEEEEYTIDSPLNNLALYREVMNTGMLDLPQDLFPGSTAPPVLNLAAAFFGASFDKAGSINMDTVVYTNAIFNLPNTTALPTVCIKIRGEEMGETAAREKCFIDYSSSTLRYEYNREQNFAGLPNPAYIPKNDIQSGEFEFLALDELAAPELRFRIAHAGIFDTVFLGVPFADNKAALSFAQAADDTRATINFMHSWPVPSDYVTNRTCTPHSETLYNLYVSSFQVPEYMIVGAEDRELLVTVGNSGRDTAEDATLEVTGRVASRDGSELVKMVLGYNGTDSILQVDKNEPFDLKSGETRTFTGFVPVQLTDGGQGSTIEWTAEIKNGTDGLDILLSDNIMTAETGVKQSGGGSGGGRGSGGSGGGRGDEVGNAKAAKTLRGL